MDGWTPTNQFPPKKGSGFQKWRDKRKQLQHSADIEFFKGATLQSVPSLSKQLQTVTICVIGLQYVWEYRSPTKSVQPHYLCKLCGVSRLQHDMLAHVKGWKHCLKYLQKAHPGKVTQSEEEAVKDPVIRKSIKEAAAEVEKSEGRGQLKVLLKEPGHVLAFKGLPSAVPKARPPPPIHPKMGPAFDGRLPEEGYSEEFPPGGQMSDYPEEDYGDPGFESYQQEEDFSEHCTGQTPYHDNDDYKYPQRTFAGSFGLGGGGDGNGRRGLLDRIPDRIPNQTYPMDFQRGQMGGNLMNRQMERPLERPSLMGANPQNGNQSKTLFNHLDTFQIENEDDAQMVLMVTRKLTDILMEYRLRSVSKQDSSLTNLSMGSNNFTPEPSRLPSVNNRWLSSLQGPSRYYK